MNKKQQKNDISEILHLFLKLHIKYPKWRLGQIVANAVREFDGRVNCDPFYLSDEDLIIGLEKLLK